ncbi:SDR family oxidoreductase [Flammeovirga sp. SJP92]|uniref:SDR family oxidoreductase n=1 Tax=Flammeovirga sp. SJP92 TaxID=1775430 RepID=UPI0007897561|nr:SDR family oxidoreductase [Flammeovirga sp. SJP92]KXX68577.1 Vi polysaccharide biosynthesis protein VipB/TviC [Flammeovirga sp. SJP92]
MNQSKIVNSKVLVTGGAGFIGSNLVEVLLEQGNKVVVLDNFSTGKRENVEPFLSDLNFKLIEGDIRNLNDCMEACDGMEYVLHQAALGSVPRSINDPITSNEVNVGGFLNMLISVRDKGVKRMVYAASSSTYGDHPGLPKVENKIGNPLSPYAVTKYVNELYADVFSKTYGVEVVGLRYFNVFGKRQDPFGAYAAVIPLFIKALINHESPMINGDGTHSRDFTYIDNVVQMNQLAALTQDKGSINTVYNTAQGENTSLNELIISLKKNLTQFDSKIKEIEATHREERVGDVKHSLADISKAVKLLNYQPTHNVAKGINEAIEWYWNYFNNK